MKIRLSVITGIATAMATTNLVTAAVAPPHSVLPNLDSRKSFTNTTAAVRLQTATASAALLSTQVSGVRFQPDTRTGGARFLAAQRGFLTGVGGNGKGLSAAGLNALPLSDPYRVVKAFANEHAAVFGHDALPLNAAQVKVDAITARNGMRTVIWQQRQDDIPVYGALFVSHLTKNEELVSVSSRFVSDLSHSASLVPGRASLVSNPPLNATAATRRAALDLGETNALIQLTQEMSPAGAEQKQSFLSPRLNGETYAQLVWLPLQDDSLQLCWQVILTSKARPEMYLTLVNAQNGNVLLRRCLTAYATPATFNVYTSDSPSPFSPGLNTPSNFQPPVVSRTSVTLTALNNTASPNGWINDGGNQTVGNNVDAHLDRNDDDLPDMPRPQGSPNRVFDFPLDLAQSPGTYGNASVVNLFYWNNFVHDRMYDFGFTEAFGNFQTTNFNRGGAGNDAVSADGQDGGGFNNANFATPPDGMPGRMQMYIFSESTPDRDGSLDAEVMVHEYGHGISNRLLGGGAGISELQTAGMGEGWSDFYALSLLSEATDDPHAVYATGGYLTYQFFGLDANYYFGIRRYPYCTDLSKNPLTFKDIDPTKASTHPGVPISPIFGGSQAEEVHNQGEVWCMTLWEVRANLIDKLGAVAGNQTMLQLVTDGLKLAPENATFIEARDGILLADEVLTGGDNLAELWYGFAKRGMGFSASAPTSDTTTGVTEAYDVPDYVITGPTDGILEVRITPATGAALIGNTTNSIFVRVTDGKAVTNATVTASLSTGGTLSFANNGQLPDLVANDANYTGKFVVPNLSTNVTLTLVITAPGKDSATNLITYAIVPPPPNDFFTNAIKVPAAGSNYITLNDTATIESGEPIHAGVQSTVASLWWTYTPTANGSVLVDTAGSQADTVVAVYTNNTLAGLQTVVATNDVGSRQQAYVIFAAKAGVAYRIAVASYDDNSTGTIRLAIVPGGTPDTTAPSVTVASPVSGLTVTTNRVTLVVVPRLIPIRTPLACNKSVFGSAKLMSGRG
ncbi:MAG: M36 family metallopeptidase [Verrucomicrobiota bacterium]